MSPVRSIDQAIDKYANFIDAEAYEQYLKTTYRSDREERAQSWNEHYSRMNIALSRTMLRILNTQQVQHEKMNLMLVGPGYEPVGNEITQDTVDIFLKRMHSITVVDISQDVARSARESLIRSGVDEKKVYAVQYDVTAGLSTVYGMKLEKLFENVYSLGDYLSLSERLKDVPMRYFEQRRMECMDEKQRNRQFNPPPRVIGGGENEARTMRFTVGGSPLPMHLTAYQMVLAGTGAAAEGKTIWGRLEDVADSDTEHDPQETEAIVREIRENMHELIARFNTHVATQTVRKVIEDNIAPDNPQPRVLAYTDINTTYLTPDHGEMPRLDIHDLAKQLNEKDPAKRNMAPRIRMSVHDSSKWEDQEDHYHGTRVLQFRQVEDTEKPAGDSGVLSKGIEEKLGDGGLSKQTVFQLLPPMKRTRFCTIEDDYAKADR